MGYRLCDASVHIKYLVTTVARDYFYYANFMKAVLEKDTCSEQ